MKKFLFLYCLLLMLGISQNSLLADNDRDEKKAEFVRLQVDSCRFKIDVSTANPVGGRTVMLSSGYSLELKGDSVFSFLPYYGRAYNIPYGGGEGLRFNTSIKDFNKRIKKHKYILSFTAVTKEDTFHFFVTIFDNGRANISLTMQNRSSISFSGEVDATELQ